MFGVCADTPEQLRAFREDHGLPFTMLSDPMLKTAAALDSPVSAFKGYYGALALHPVIRHYPKKAFLQPAVFVWKERSLVFSWRQTEKLTNLYGASNRPDGDAIVQIASNAMA